MTLPENIPYNPSLKGIGFFLALTLLNYVFPVGGLVVQLTTTTVVTLVGLLAKGAIAAFYLRERGSHSEDGAAYIIAQDEPP